MTKHAGFIRMPWLTALSLGVTMGGWALLGSRLIEQKPTSTTPVTPESSAESQSVAVVLPPVPTIEALRVYTATSISEGTVLNLPPVSIVVEPAPHKKSVQAPVSQAQQVPPITNTGSSR